MTHALETGLVRIRAFTLRRCWFGAASNYKCLCVRAYIYVCEWVNVWVSMYVCAVYERGALVYVWRIYIYITYILTTVCVCVCTCWASITSPWTSHTHTHTHTYIFTKQPANGRHRKTYFPLKTYNAGVRQCVVCCVVWQRWGRKNNNNNNKKRKHHKNRGETHE